MINVKRPVLLDASLQPARTLNVENVDLVLNSPGVSQATITLPPSETEPPIHAFLDIYNQNGFVGVFRVSVPTTDYAQQHSIVVRHAIDTLADSVFAAQIDFSGTVTQFLTQLLSYQTTKVGNVACWQLGTCEDSATIKKSLNYDRLNDLLSALEEDEEGYCFTYDQSSFPWMLNFVAKPQAVGTEFRRGRNIRAISRTLNDNDLCTQLILSVNVETTATDTTTGNDSTTTETAIRTYDNAEAQAVYGIIQRTADIDTHDNIAGQSFPEADAWAQRFLAEHASPAVQLQIDGDEYSVQTGDSLDETKLGHLCAVPLPEYGQDFSLRIVSIRYPSALSDPRHVTASLSTQLPKFSSSIASLKKAEAATAKAARSAARSAAKAKELKQWSMVVTDQQLALDGTGIMELYESGISMDAHGGVKIYSLMQGFQSLYGGIEVANDHITAEVTRATEAEGVLSGRITTEAGKIGLVVEQVNGQNKIKAASIVAEINDSASSVKIDADHIAIQATSGSGLTIDANGNISLNANEAVTTINSATVNIDADVIDINGLVPVLNAEYVRTDILESTTSDIGVIYTAGLFVNDSSGSVIAPTLSASGTLRIGSSSGQGSETGSLYFQGTQYYQRTMRLGTSSPYIFAGKVLSDNNTDVSLNHYHDITATEGTGADEGKVFFESGAVRSTPGTADFNIAATAFYNNGVAAAEAAGIASVTLSQAAPSNGVVRVSASNGQYEDVDWRTADLISKITLSSSDTGTDVQKTANVRYNNGDSTTGVSVTIDASAVYAAGQASATPSGSDIWIGVTGSPGSYYSSRPADTSGSSSKSIGIYYDTPDGWLCLRNGTVYYDGGITGLTAYNGGSPATLYYETPGGTYASLGSHYWYYK